jgi:hypothetical protein
MLNAFVLALGLVGQHPMAHHSSGHAGSHIGGVHVGGAAGHPGGHAASAMEHQVMQDIVQHEAAIRQQRQQEYQHHVAMINQDLPRLRSHFQEMRFEQRHWEELRHHHDRLGVDTFWRLARKHREIDKLLAALKSEKGQVKSDSTEGRMARLKARHETWDILAESRFFAYLKERKFEHKHWESLRSYYERLGSDTFWRLTREHRDLEPLRLALSTELRRKLLASLEDEEGPQPSQVAKPLHRGLIEISPVEFKVGKTTDGPRTPVPNNQ